MIDAIKGLLSSVPDQISALVIAGAAGAYVRAVFAPESSWKRRIVEGVAGALSAIFLGGLVGFILDTMTGAGVWAYSAAGFVMGEGGIAATRGVRAMILERGAK